MPHQVVDPFEPLWHPLVVHQEESITLGWVARPSEVAGGAVELEGGKCILFCGNFSVFPQALERSGIF